MAHRRACCVRADVLVAVCERDDAVVSVRDLVCSLVWVWEDPDVDECSAVTDALAKPMDTPTVPDMDAVPGQAPTTQKFNNVILLKYV